MALVLTSAPAVEPVSLDDAKAHLRIDGDGEDAIVATLVTVSRTHVERSLGRALITQGWQLVLDGWPVSPWLALPIMPVQAVGAITTYASDDAPTVFASDHYTLDAHSQPARLVLRGAQSWPVPGRRANGIEITLTAGYGDAAEDVPAPLRQALLLLIAHWYERREPVVLDAAAADVPATVAGLIAPYRTVRL